MLRMSQGQRAATQHVAKDQMAKVLAMDDQPRHGPVARQSGVSAGAASALAAERQQQNILPPNVPASEDEQSRDHEARGATSGMEDPWDVPEEKNMMDVLNEKIQSLQEDPVPDTAESFRHKFDLVVCGLVVLNVVCIALEMDFGPREDAEWKDRLGWWILESIFTFIFLVEICMRIHWEGRRWPRSVWNWFDVCVVMCAVFDVWFLTVLDMFDGDLQALTILRIFRMVRLVRMVKLVRTLQSLYCIIMALWHALHSMMFLGGIMIFGVFLYSIFATVIIGRNSVFDGVMINGDTVDDRFGKVYRSMYSLFELMTLEGWEQVARPLVTRQPLVFLFIGSFIMIFTFGMLNMVVAVVVEKTLDQTQQMSDFAKAETRKQMAQELRRMKSTFMGSDIDNDGKITLEEFNEGLRDNEAVQNLLTAMGIPNTDATELFRVLDWNGDEEVTIKEFMQGLGKIQSGAPSPWDTLATHAGVRSLRRNVSELEQQLGRLERQQQEQGTLLEEALELLKRPSKELH